MPPRRRRPLSINPGTRTSLHPSTRPSARSTTPSDTDPLALSPIRTGQSANRTSRDMGSAIDEAGRLNPRKATQRRGPRQKPPTQRKLLTHCPAPTQRHTSTSPAPTQRRKRLVTQRDASPDKGPEGAPRVTRKKAHLEARAAREMLEEVTEEGDLVPPSSDEEYEEWITRREGNRLRFEGKGESGPSTPSGQNAGVHEYATGNRQLELVTADEVVREHRGMMVSDKGELSASYDPRATTTLFSSPLRSPSLSMTSRSSAKWSSSQSTSPTLSRVSSRSTSPTIPLTTSLTDDDSLTAVQHQLLDMEELMPHDAEESPLPRVLSIHDKGKGRAGPEPLILPNSLPDPAAYKVDSPGGTSNPCSSGDALGEPLLPTGSIIQGAITPRHLISQISSNRIPSQITPRRPSQPVRNDSPFLEAQIGPHNAHLVSSPLRRQYSSPVGISQAALVSPSPKGPRRIDPSSSTRESFQVHLSIPTPSVSHRFHARSNQPSTAPPQRLPTPSYPPPSRSPTSPDKSNPFVLTAMSNNDGPSFEEGQRRPPAASLADSHAPPRFEFPMPLETSSTPSKRSPHDAVDIPMIAPSASGSQHPRSSHIRDQVHPPLPRDKAQQSEPVADPALERFRTARTFRTRTVLQLQPYTKEKQIYEAALRRGGLKKGRNIVAPASEITPNEEETEEEGRVDSSSASSEAENPERIVIGPSPSERVTKARIPKALVEADFDEFCLEHGEAADEAKPEHAKELQRIARKRLRETKAEKKRLREAAKTKKRFESFMRGVDGVQGERSSDSERELEPDPTAKQNVPAQTPGRATTYGRRTRPARPAEPPPTPHGGPLSIGPQTSSETPLIPSLDMEFPIFDNPLATAYSDDDPLALSPVRQDILGHREHSFFVEDMSPPRANLDDPTPSSVDTADSNGGMADSRAKIARRMMPAVMLRRLEREAGHKQTANVEKKRREDRQADLPLRPGRSVTKRHEGGPDGLSNFFDEVASEGGESNQSRLSADRPTSPAELLQWKLIVISDDSASDVSQAVEDNFGGESLAQLYRGDFESIVGGKRAVQAHHRSSNLLARQAARNDRSRIRRPALGLASRTPLPIAKTRSRDLFQTRLGFPVQEKTPARRGKSDHRQLKRHNTIHRPAIRLDDHVIFSNADFAFDDEPVRPPKSASRTFKRTFSKTFSEPDAVDTGIGKARSWANFDKFPIDFDITPLPSGIFCSEDSVVGNGKVQELVGLIRGGSPLSTGIIRACSAYGVMLREDLDPTAVGDLLPIVFDGLLRSVVTYANDASSETPSYDAINFLGSYISLLAGGAQALAVAIEIAIADTLRKLQEVGSGGKQSKGVRDEHLKIRWALLDLAIRLSLSHPTSMAESAKSLVEDCAATLLRQLLSSGFDKTIRPLKAILRGESESAKISDTSIVTWIATIHSLSAWDARDKRDDLFIPSLNKALDAVFGSDQVGPIAAERVWFVNFGLCALSQFDANGRIGGKFVSTPRWSLVRKAVGLIKIAHNEEAEEKAHVEQLQGRDRYIKAMIARCVRLSSVWQWYFDRESFSVATKDLGVIFKERQHRNLPTEPPVDFPAFITHFDMSLTVAGDSRRESAFELYLRLVCVAASDILAAAESLAEAQQAEKDVQRLIMSIIPVSPVKFNRILPPSSRQLGQLINRYSTMVAACYFSPSLLTWLFANSRKWAPFEQADIESRQIGIRGLMYLAVACRHHGQSLRPVVARLADILAILQKELDQAGQSIALPHAPSRDEVERTMVLVVSCFRQIILHHSFVLEQQAGPVYPDPCLLHESWTARIFNLDLASDLKCGTEIVATIQAFLDTRSAAMPRLARQRREAREAHADSLDEFSLGIDFSAVDLAALGGEARNQEDPIEMLDVVFAKIITDVISPKIYRLLSDMMPAAEVTAQINDARLERQQFIGKLTKCWSDCTGVVVVERNSSDGWTPYIGAFGQESWQRLRNEQGRIQVGLHFMLNVAKLDPGAFAYHAEDFVALLFQTIVTDKLTVEHQYLNTVLGMPGALGHPLLWSLADTTMPIDELDKVTFMETRASILHRIFANVPLILRDPQTPTSQKTFTYRCINLLVSAIISNQKSIDPSRVIHRESYRAFADTTIRDLRRLAGDIITPSSVPGLRNFAA